MSKLQHLDLYYEYYYPYETLVEWLTYGGTKPLKHRELSFQYPGGSVQRYVTFQNAQQMRKRMTSRFDQLPNKVDAGAIWNQIPKKQSKAKTQERQLIFDFDMNDYDDVRNCCQGKTICKKCWKLLIVAVEIITKTLEEDFDLHKFMYVFSGGRGIHIWVCDERARKMKDSVRRAVVDYIELVTGNDKTESLLADNVVRPVQKLPHSQYSTLDFYNKKALKEYYISKDFSQQAQRSLQILDKYFMQIFKDQEGLQTEKSRAIVEKILNSRSKVLKERVVEIWKKCQNKTQILYAAMLQEINYYQMCRIQTKQYENKVRPEKPVYRNLTFIEEQIKLSFLYPRMDYNVSTAQNHLLKLPFSIHPSSKKVSVPMFEDKIKDFDPDSKNIKFQTLIAELKQLTAQYTAQNLTREIVMRNSPLNDYVSALERFVKQCQ